MSGTVTRSEIRAALDATEYTRGAAQVDAANRGMVSSGEAVVVTTEKVEQTTTRGARSFETVSGRLDGAIRATQQYNKDVAALDAALKRGLTTQEEYNRLLALAQQRQVALAASAGQAGTAFRGAGQTIQQAGFQLQDFVVQVQAGTSWLTALSQQGSQFLGIFGAGGAVAGAALAIGAVAAQFLTAGQNAEEMRRRGEASFKALNEAATTTRDLLAEVNALFLSANQNASNAANAALASTREGLIRQQDIAVQMMEGAQIELGTARRELAAQEAREAAELNRRLSSLEGRRAAEQGRLAEFIAPFEEQMRQNLFTSTQRVYSLEADIRRYGSRSGDVAQALERLRSFGTIDFDLPSPPVPPGDEGYGTGGGGGSSRAGRDPNQYGPLDGSQQGLTTLERGRIQALEAENRDRERLEREERQSLDRREAANRRVTDNIVNYAADSFATLFDENGRGWDGMWQTFEQTAKRTIARIAADAVIRPIVEPIVSGLGLGGSSGGSSGIVSSLFGGSVSGGGGTSYARSMLGAGGGGGGSGGLLSQIGGFISNPIYQEGFGFFQPNATGAINAASSAAPWLIPSMPTSGGALANIGSVSLGNYAAGIGGGYMIGSQLGGYIAKTDAQRLNSQIGAGGGAAAGALIGAAVGGPFAPVTAVIGGLIGGAAGGAGGGLLGPSSAFRGGDVQIGIVNGQLAIVGSGGKRWDAGAARSQSQAGLDSLNQALASAGVSIGQSGAIGWQGYGGSKNVLGPTEIWNATHNNLTTSNPTLQAALGQGWMQSFEDLSFIAPYAAQNDNLTRALGSGGIRSRVDFNAASGFISGTYEPMVKAASVTDTFAEAVANLAKTFDDAIGRSRELGLATDTLTAKRDKEVSAMLAQRDTAVSEALASLRVDELNAAGDTKGAAWASYSLSSAQRLRQAQGFLTQNGYGEGTDLYAQTTARLMALFDKERTALAASLNPAANDTGPTANSGTALLQDLFAGELGGQSLQSRYAFGVTTLGNLRRAGDLDAYTSFASRFIDTARNYLGTSERFGQFVGRVRNDTVSLGGDPTGMLLDAQQRAANGIEQLVASDKLTRDELTALRRELGQALSRLTAIEGRRAA